MIRLFILTSAIVFCACSGSGPVASKADVYSWGSENLETAMSQTDVVLPKFFEVALVPSDFNYDTVEDLNVSADEPVSISPDNALFLRDVGIVSALAEYCDLPWNERNFLPMMQWQRAHLSKDERQGVLITRIGFSHGFAMGRTGTLLNVWQPDCTLLRNDLDGRMFADVFPGFEVKVD